MSVDTLYRCDHGNLHAVPSAAMICTAKHQAGRCPGCRCCGVPRGR